MGAIAMSQNGIPKSKTVLPEKFYARADDGGSREAIRHIRNALARGRRIVPLLGAGISVESGYPTTAAIVRYLAKARYFFQERLYWPSPALPGEPDFELNSNGRERGRPTEASEHRAPSTRYNWNMHLRYFGWPDPYELNSLLWSRFADGGAIGDSKEHLDHVIRHELCKLQEGRLGQLPEALPQLAMFLEKKGYLREFLEEPIAPSTNGSVAEHEREKARRAREFLSDARWPEVRPTWRETLREATEFHAEHVDALFHCLNRNRRPGTSHRFLAFLARLLNWDLVLTTNFDDLLERGMRSEGLSPQVFDIWQGADLPHPSLVRDTLSVVKLHGSAYGLRVGETLDDPLRIEDRRRFLDYLPEGHLLLVLGYAGQDRRIMEFVEAVVGAQSRSEVAAVIWLHFGPSSFPERLPDRASVKRCRTNDATAFLVELYSELTSVHPVTAYHYAPLSTRALGVPAHMLRQASREQSGSARSNRRRTENREKTVHVFTCKATKADAYFQDDCCSLEMSEFVDSLGATHQPIWVDLSAYQSVEAVVQDIIHQCRKHDVRLPRVIFPMTGQTGQNYGPAVRRVVEALRRGHYVLALDDVGTFGRQPTVHHGVHAAFAKEVTPGFDVFLDFLRELVKEAEGAGDSFVCLAFNGITTRFKQRRRAQGHLAKLIEKIEAFRKFLDGEKAIVHKHPVAPVVLRQGHKWLDAEKLHGDVAEKIQAAIAASDLRFQQSPLDWRPVVDDFMALVSTFRKPRSLVALRELATEFLPEPNSGRAGGSSRGRRLELLEMILEILHAERILIRQEGGLFWMTKSLHERIYEHSANDATGEEFMHLLERPSPATLEEHGHEHAFRVDRGVSDNRLRVIIRVLARVVYNHEQIARYCHDHQFRASKDLAAFGEYLYHRISSLRYATNLAALAWQAGDRRLRTAIKEIRSERPRSLPDPVGRFLSQLYGDGVVGTRFTCSHRIKGIRALYCSITDSRERVLSHIAAEVLRDWIKWIERHDIPRFKTSFHIRGRGPKEEEIEEECRGLLRLLATLKADAFNDMTDFEGSIAARLAIAEGANL
jgi:hypothetical protein